MFISSKRLSAGLEQRLAKNTHTCSLLFYSLCSEFSPKVKGQRQGLSGEWQEGERCSSCVFSHSVTGVLAPPEDMCSPRAPLSSTQSLAHSVFGPAPSTTLSAPPPTPPPPWHHFLQRPPVPSGHLKDRRSGKKGEVTSGRVQGRPQVNRRTSAEF